MTAHSRYAPPDVDLASLPRARLEDMRAAADDMIEVLQEAADSGRHILVDVLNAAPEGSEFTEWEHYPPGDVHDKTNGAIWFYHAHARDEGESRPWDEHGHFHMFVYTEKLGAGAVPLALPKERDEQKGGLCHLAAVSFDMSGAPMKIFSTNRWVADEWMYSAGDVIGLLDRFKVDNEAHALTSRWLMAALRLYRPQIEWALKERDRVLATAREKDPEGFGEDKDIEVLSAIDFDLAGQIDAIESVLGD